VFGAAELDRLWALVDGERRRVAMLPAGHEELVDRSAILLGLRQLARWLGPPRQLGRGHPMVAGRVARLRRLLGGPARPGGLR
jgi:hypothetical protein